MTTIEQNILDSLHESTIIWEVDQARLFFNTKTLELYEAEAGTYQRLEEIWSVWSFFDSEGNLLQTTQLPPHKVLKTKEACLDEIFCIVSATGEHSKWINMSATPMFSKEGNIETVIVTTLDITAQKADEQKYKYIANYDPLTKLPNRTLLADRLDLAISHAERNQKSLAVCLIDLDGFKEVNDTFGHEAGDAVLIEAANRMKKVVRADDTVARLGGDEFVVILTELGKSEECAVSLYRLLNTIARPYHYNDHEITTISASIGVSLYPDDKVEPGTLLRHADIAMYKAKNSGKNKFSFFDIISDQKIKANYKTINKIKNSLAAGEFCLYYQPKVNTLTSEIVEVEALARWNHPLLGVVSPAEFLPLIENDDELCDRFDQWVILESLLQLQEWQKMGLYLKICLNISPKQFKRRQFMTWLKEVIDRSGATMDLLSYLEFEILETAALESLNRSNEIIRECRELGITFALDDFGTGYSSMMHLKELHIDTIKIDRIFVSGMLDNSANMVIVQAIVALGNAFDISVTAEGAENLEQVMSLLEIGCDAIQGYAIARPMPKEEVAPFIANFKPDPRWKIASQTLPSKADFELLLAASNHKYWVEQLVDAFSKNEIDEKALRLDSTQCRFGKWFGMARNKKYKQAPSFAKLDALHQQIHNHAKTIYGRLKAEQRSITPEESEQIEQISRELTTTLERIRKEVESIRRKNNLIDKILDKRSRYGK